MKAKTKAWLIIAVSFIFGGILLAGIGAAMGGTFKYSYFFENGHIKFSKGSDKYVTNTVTVSDFEKLKISSRTVDVNIVKGDKYSVSYNVPERYVPKISDGKTLEIEVPSSNGLFFNFMNFDSEESPNITVSIPSDDKFKFNIISSTGDIRVENIAFEGSIETDTGDIRVASSKLDDVHFETDTGDMTFEDVDASEIKTETDTGIAVINNVTANKLSSQTDTGDISINGCIFNKIEIDGSTSEVMIRNTKVETVEIETSTGDCDIRLNGAASDYSCKLTTSTGDITYDNETFEKKYTHKGNGKGDITVETSTGDIAVNFD